MPGIPGRIVAEQIAKSHPETKVLHVSGYTNDDVIRTGVLHDAVHFVQKPFAPTAIAHKVSEILTTTARTPRSRLLVRAAVPDESSLR